MVDFGLICLFVLQLGLVMLTYHAYNRISAKISELKALQKEVERVPTLLAPIESEIKVHADRIEDIAAAPAASKRRLDEADLAFADFTRQIGKIKEGLASTNARVSVLNRWLKRGNEEDGTAPAAQAEGEEDVQFIPPPGAHPSPNAPTAPALPPGFGVLKRKAG